MNQRYALSLNYIDPLSVGDLSVFYRQFLELDYDAERGFGFTAVALDTHVLTATLVRRIPTVVTQYDLEAGQMVAQTIEGHTEIDFQLDARYQLLEVFGPARDAARVRAAFRPLLHPATELLHVSLAPVSVVPKLAGIAERLTISKLVVKNFQHREEVSGKFELETDRLEVALEILQEYTFDVVKATLTVVSDDVGDFTLTLSQQGRLVLECDDARFRQLFPYLKAVLFAR